ncbi:hypothetical protein [Geobacillus genomosp. 3]|uniref:hypothetical protein n=1 Tax=Geobacillus genomosp. 3 TaxID=1921421 RepID=UPI0004060433|nr:hypothetical protein [Geobacillus genomosp. 3]
MRFLIQAGMQFPLSFSLPSSFWLSSTSPFDRVVRFFTPFLERFIAFCPVEVSNSCFVKHATLMFLHGMSVSVPALGERHAVSIVIGFDEFME